MATSTTSPDCRHVDRRPDVASWLRDHAGLAGHPRQAVTLCASYAEAELVLDRLTERGFPTDQIDVVADGEPDGGWAPTRRGRGRAAVYGLVVGAAAGSVAGALFGLSHTVGPVATTLGMALYGVALGALTGTVLAVLVQLVIREPVERATRLSVTGGASGMSAATPGNRSCYAVVAEDPASWVRAVTALYGGGEYRPMPAGAGRP
jgi:MFS family permease